MRKFLALVFIFLVFTSFTAQSVKAEGLLSDFFDMIRKWFESSPLGNIFAMPVKRIETIKLSFYPNEFEIIPEDFVNITTNESEISNFRGNMNVNMENRILLLKEDDSVLSIKKKIGTIKVESLKISTLELKGMKLALASGNWNETTQNGSVSIKDFLGEALIREGAIELQGNVSKIIKG